MRKIVLIILTCLLACGGPADFEVQDSTELDAPSDLVELTGDYGIGELGRSEQALTLPTKFCWEASDWKHETCPLSDSNAICYCPRHTDSVRFEWASEWIDENDNYVYPYAVAREELLDTPFPSSIRHSSSPPGGGSQEQQMQLIRLKDVPWGVGMGTITTLDQPLSGRTYCYGGLTYKGRAFGSTGARIYSCHRMGIDLDSAAMSLWKTLSGSPKSLNELFSTLARHHGGTALGQPTDSNAPWDSNAMLPFLDGDFDPTVFDPCQRARADLFDSSGSGVTHTAVGCGL